MPPCDELLEFLRHLLEPAAYEKAQAMVRGLTDTSSTEDPPAMDSRYRFALDSRDAFTKMRDLQAAQRETGIIVAADATATFRLALDGLGVNHRDVHPSGLPEIYRAHARQRSHGPNGGGYARPAMDGRAAAKFSRDCPEAARIRVLG